MSKVHFLNVKEGDCNIIEHESERISVIDVCNARKETSEILYEKGEELFSNVKGNFRQKETPENPITYIRDNIKTKDIFRFILTHPDMDHMDGIKDFFTFLVIFFGIISNRIGSVIIEKIYKKLKFIVHAEYKNYLLAEKNDSKIKELNDVNNMHRSILGMLFMIAICKLYFIMCEKLPCLENYKFEIAFIFLFLLFSVSYRTQTKYISERINFAINKTFMEKKA